ncbi:MAG: hypothetical protein A2919_02325 [Candidatus Spechtbacteria bacterium RIFCSPLOWO2_01_FULL_43_12]|uniref:GlxA-like beta barrel domain-containing protein n=1 Tax=Candidatus Spechtbacteria bacterium RIFCSPLOWO2_01_FULL_43_12 TaxID=1802162 RepID=A0A1G2HEF3_9BACT|nr:MAG: hypothetical protein A2919_02325 [Candidatus Spechtbacteria bacterium RIFCSPLOWO2_01_FULL_43_12]
MTNKDTIKVSSRDELASIIDKVLARDSDIILLEVSDDAYIAQNIINFRLLKREAETAGKRIVIVSENPRIQALAIRAGLRIQDGMQNLRQTAGTNSMRRGDLISQNSREVADILPPEKARSLDEQDEQRESKDSGASGGLKSFFKKEPEEELSKPEFVPLGKYEPMKDIAEHGPNVPKTSGFSTLGAFPFRVFGTVGAGAVMLAGFARNSLVKHPIKTLAVIIAIALASGTLFLATDVLPKATVVLYPKTLQDSMSFSLIADSNVSSEDYAKGIIPAQIMEEKQENNFTYEATGTAQLEERATGEIRVYNEYSSSPQTLVEATRFLSANGKLFRTAQTVVIPGAQIEGGQVVASSIIVPVVADEPGAEYNISPTTFSIPGFSGTDKYTKFYGKSERQFEGGFVGQTTIATREDLDKAEEQIETEFVSQAENALRERIPENLMVLEDSLESGIEVLEFSAKAGEPAETINARAVVYARVILIRESEISEATAYHFKNSTQYSQQFELSDERRIEYNVKEVDFTAGYAEFALNIEQLFVRKVDTGSVVSDIKGKNEIEVRRILSGLEELEKAQLKFWPFWVSKVPSNEEDITVEIQISTKLD